MTLGAVPRLFGTDGIRKIVGDELTPTFVAEVAAALSQFLGPGKSVLIANDFRTTSPGIARILAGVLSMNGIEVTELGPMPTPCLQFNVKALAANVGTMVTASHNPTDFNGIKFSGPEGLELAREDEVRIETAVAERRFPKVPWDRAGSIRQDSLGVSRYLTSIRSIVDLEAIRARKLRVVLDCGNGTSAATSPPLLRELGCVLTTLNANPDGHFPGHPSEPTEANLADLRRAVKEFGADVGIAHDGDSDRVAFVDETGRYVPGEETLGLFAREVLRREGRGAIVTSVTSTRCVEQVVASEGGEIVITRSGSLPVAEAIVARKALFGGEENGGYYWPKHQVARDGPASSAKMLELLARASGPLSKLVAELPKFHVVKKNVPLPAARKPSVMEAVLRQLEGEAQRTVTIDGVKAFYPDGWILVRPSGTEPICRIFAESQEPARAKELCDKGVQLVERLQASG